MIVTEVIARVCDGLIGDVIKQLVDIQIEAMGRYRNVEIVFDSGDYFGTPYADVYVQGERDETETEKLERLKVDRAKRATDLERDIESTEVRLQRKRDELKELREGAV